MASKRAQVVDWADGVYQDLSFGTVKAWLAEHPGRKAGGFLPVYATRELLHAAGMLPVGIWGGGDRLEIIKGDAFYQSYICHLPRSVVELAQSGRLDWASAMLFPSTCDVIRNLSGIWSMLYPSVYVRYLDVPQVAEPQIGEAFWENELRTMHRELCEVAGAKADPESLRSSNALYNQSRALVRQLYQVRAQAPWKIPTTELYLLLRAGEVVGPEVFAAKAREYLAAVDEDPGRPRDKARVIVVGSFCEQPPLGLIKTLEHSGCYVVDDDFVLGNRFLTAEVPTDGDPYRALAATLARHATASSVMYERDPQGKRRLMETKVKACQAEGIVFAAPSFCDPALLDRPMLKAGADAANIPSVSFRYAENTGQFQQFREQAGTFADSIKLWGGA